MIHVVTSRCTQRYQGRRLVSQVWLLCIVGLLMLACVTFGVLFSLLIFDENSPLTYQSGSPFNSDASIGPLSFEFKFGNSNRTAVRTVSFNHAAGYTNAIHTAVALRSKHNRAMLNRLSFLQRCAVSFQFIIGRRAPRHAWPRTAHLHTQR